MIKLIGYYNSCPGYLFLNNPLNGLYVNDYTPNGVVVVVVVVVVMAKAGNADVAISLFRKVVKYLLL